MYSNLMIVLPFLCLILRVVVGANFVFGRGYRQLIGDRDNVIAFWKAQKVPMGATVAAAFLNLVGGIFLIIGLLVPVVALFFALEMAFTVYIHKHRFKTKYFGHMNVGYELNVVYILVMATLIVIGAGYFSVDSLIGI
ncbi:MAG TPA: DoxX family protein [Nitrososphaerales archaeon]|nr:DoxX family protein [Nitrososphaerales archaeon]